MHDDTESLKIGQQLINFKSCHRFLLQEFCSILILQLYIILTFMNCLQVISCLNNERETHMMGDAYKKVDWYSRGVKFDASEDEEDKDEDTEEDDDDDDEDDDEAEGEDEKEEERRPHKDQYGEQDKSQLVKEGGLEDAGQLSRREEAGKSFKEAFEAQRSGKKKKKKAVPDGKLHEFSVDDSPHGVTFACMQRCCFGKCFHTKLELA